MHTPHPLTNIGVLLPLVHCGHTSFREMGCFIYKYLNTYRVQRTPHISTSFFARKRCPLNKAARSTRRASEHAKGSSIFAPKQSTRSLDPTARTYVPEARTTGNGRRNKPRLAPRPVYLSTVPGDQDTNTRRSFFFSVKQRLVATSSHHHITVGEHCCHRQTMVDGPPGTAAICNGTSCPN